MCRHARRNPRSLQLLAFRKLAENKTCEGLKYINKSCILRNYFAQIEFVVKTDYCINERGFCYGNGSIVKGNEIVEYIKKRVFGREYIIEFWCYECRKFCDECCDLYESCMNRYNTQLQNCKECKLVSI